MITEGDRQRLEQLFKEIDDLEIRVANLNADAVKIIQPYLVCLETCEAIYEMVPKLGYVGFVVEHALEALREQAAVNDPNR